MIKIQRWRFDAKRFISEINYSHKVRNLQLYTPYNEYVI